MAQGLLIGPMHPFDSFAAYRDNRSPGLTCGPEVDPDQANIKSESSPQRFSGRLKSP